MPNAIFAAVVQAFEKAATVDEVYDAAEQACERCAMCPIGRCPGQASCPMYSILNLKLDAIEVLA